MFNLDLDSGGARDQIANICWIFKKAREVQKNICFCVIYYTKALDCVDDNKLWKILKEMGILDNLTCSLRNLYAGQEATVKTGHGIIDWFQIWKGIRQGCILSPCLFNLYAEWVKVAQSCLTLCDPMAYTVHGILQVRILEWIAFHFSRGSSQPRNWTQVSRTAGRFFTSWTTREAQSTSLEMLDWMKYKLESRLLGDISITSDMQATPPLWQKAKKN